MTGTKGPFWRWMGTKSGDLRDGWKEKLETCLEKDKKHKLEPSLEWGGDTNFRPPWCRLGTEARNCW